jgi:CheY-like chemotaxis protein
LEKWNVDRDFALALVAIVPQLLGLGLVAGFALRYGESIGRALGGRVSSVAAFGFKIELNAASIDHAIASRPSGSKEVASRSGRLMSSQAVVDRARRLARQIRGRTILWVDDEPTRNSLERQLLRQMGIFVETVVSNDEAITALDDLTDTFDLIISDIDRGKGHSGLELVEEVVARGTASRTRSASTRILTSRKRPIPPQIVLYITSRDPDKAVPLGVLGIAYRPDELLNLVMDALDRLPADRQASTSMSTDRTGSGDVP